MTHAQQWPEGIPGEKPGSVAPQPTLIWMGAALAAMLGCAALAALAFTDQLPLFCLATGVGCVLAGLGVREAFRPVVGFVETRMARSIAAPAMVAAAEGAGWGRPGEATVRFTDGAGHEHEAQLPGSYAMRVTLADLLLRRGPQTRRLTPGQAFTVRYDPLDHAWVAPEGSDPGSAYFLGSLGRLFIGLGGCMMAVAALMAASGM